MAAIATRHRGVILTLEQDERLVELAKNEGITVNELVRRIISEHLQMQHPSIGPGRPIQV